MSQLNLFVVPGPPKLANKAKVFDRATHLVHVAAGEPTPESSIKVADGQCYWCGQRFTGSGRTVKSLSNTFADACGKQAAVPSSPVLCAACGWSLSDGVALPHRVASRMLKKALDGDGRFTYLLDDGGGKYALALLLADGSVGVWARAKGAAAKLWVEQREILQEKPQSIKGCELLSVHSYEDAIGRAAGKFRNFIAYADDSGSWDLHTKAERKEIREHLLNPYRGLWTLCIGDGQKHAVIYGSISDGRAGVQSVYLEGSGIVEYVPEELKVLLEAVESLILAGARDEEILSGNYRGKASIEWMRAQRSDEPRVSNHRGTGALDVALWLRRSVKDLREAKDD